MRRMVLFLPVLLLLASLPGVAEDAPSDPPAIVVNGVAISRGEFDRHAESDFLEALSQAGLTGVDPNDPSYAEARRRIEARTAQRIIGRLLLLTNARATGISALDSEIEESWEASVANYGGAETVEAALAASGRTEDDVRRDIEESIIIQKYLNMRIGEIEITDSDARNYYDENPEAFTRGETVRCRHILIETADDALERIEGIRDEIVGGLPFEEAAERYSEGPSASRGGDLGVFGRGRMVAPFEEAAFSLPVGEVSEPVETRFGWHLILVEEHDEGGLVPFDEIEDNLKNELVREEEDRRLQGILNELGQEGEIEVNLDPSTTRGE